MYYTIILVGCLFLPFLLSYESKKGQTQATVPPENKKIGKIKPPNFGANSPAVQNDRVRHSLDNFTNGD